MLQRDDHAWNLPPDSRRHSHVCSSINTDGVDDLSTDYLIAGSRQREAIRPSVGAHISSGEIVIPGQNSRGIGTREVDAAVDHRIRMAIDGHRDGNSKRGTRHYGAGSREIQNGMSCTAARA